MIADSCGSREIKVDILELLAKAREINAIFSFFPSPFSSREYDRFKEWVYF